jgi:hypothetical protein
MKHLKQLCRIAAMALVANCGVVGSASATTIEPASTAVTLSSANWSFQMHGGATVSCTASTVSGTTPAAGPVATWKALTDATLTYTGCMAIGFVNATVTPNAGCHTAATAPQLHLMGVNAATAVGVLTLPSGCNIDISIPAIGCTWTIPGFQPIGNSTGGTGGIQWTNASPNIAHVNGARVPTVASNGVGIGCGMAGDHTGTVFGNYTRTSATNVTVTP